MNTHVDRARAAIDAVDREIASWLKIRLELARELYDARGRQRDVEREREIVRRVESKLGALSGVLDVGAIYEIIFRATRGDD